ncbi:Probable amino-acid ABC transporter permease protein YckJ [Propionibacterium freudenreichii]|uniref:amino acid ABC transporter permease n=1 Tax=Propionibacterium freudenreichii TaxID=1744 RepID=UPI0005A5C352|nr:amino acid ABC transporter permease [Propionibacterium freudenreichii]MDK9331175.1 amino acid ABC transporter permease [Propionibacterium freudenreichii]CEI49961.1 polar amino acid ABC transporter, inner membrane protein [Propionibacterium freudenreichii]SBN59086.1 Probable amino-acid ABC transporter permease protein YckJ [Propionibacterium freudenreichii]SBN94546.1 Probable amino-acid ABC transporter permease protein YckJ [Propionibacterium freudenreichii]SCC96130.1 Probable amino-acid ABC
MEGFTAIIAAVPYTALVTLGAFGLGFVLAIPLMFARRARLMVVRGISGFIVDLARGIPPIVWLLMIYFGLPNLGIMLDPIPAAIIGLGIITAGYLAEIFRGGMLAVRKGQFEAANALGLGGWTSFTRVVAPQAMRAMQPGLTTYSIGLIKDSSIASVIGVTEMVYTANSYAKMSKEGVLLFFEAALIYLVISVPLGLLARRIEAHKQEASAR